MTEQIRLQTADGLSLEGELAAPDSPVAALVLCHPHPKMGGTMNAPLLTGLEAQMNTLGWAVLRFNFRGLGSSAGEFGLGIDEMKDASAAVQYVRERFPELPVAIAGWSFGAAVAVRVALERDDLLACVAIAPAITEKPGVTAGIPAPTDVTLNLPLLIIVGANDHLVDPDACEQWAAATGAQCTVVPGANHFFWAKYNDLNNLVAAYLANHV